MATAGPEGTEGGAINVEKFLKDHKLTYVADKFKEKDVSIEELFEFTSDELSEWATSDLGLDTLAKRRLVKAIAALKPQSQPLTTNASMPSHFGSIQSGQSPMHVIVSPEEHDAISKLYQRFDDTNKLIEELESSFKLLDTSANECKISVTSGFEEIINILKSKKESLSEECTIVGNDKKSKLMQQLESLKKYCNVITNGKKKYEEYIGDSTIDIHKRKTAIVNMIDNIINDNSVSLVMVTQPKIGFPVNQKQIDRFLSSLAIDDCDQPFPPLLIIKKTGFTVIEIEWEIDTKQEQYQTSNKKNILDFAIEWTKVPKSNYKKMKGKDGQMKKSKSKLKDASNKSDSKSLKKNKNKKDKKSKKSKKKSKKKRKESDDSSGDSDESSDEKKLESDDSESDSSSDSESDDSSSSDSDSSSSDSSDSESEDIKKRLKSAKFEIDDESIDYDKLKWDEVKIKNKMIDERSSKKSKKKKSKFKLKYKIKELKDETPYIIRMRCRNSSGWGQYCDPKIVITKKLTINSKILKEKEKVYLLKLLPNNLKKKRFKLIYRASVDSFSSYKFHQKCDNKGATITIIRSTMNHVFGGYTSIPWSTVSNNYVNDHTAFIFLLRSTRGNAPVKWNIKNAGNAVYHNASYGPTFGGGFDFYLCDNCNSVNSSYANLGNSYAAPTDRNLLAGSYNFTVSDYEVYQLS